MSGKGRPLLAGPGKKKFVRTEKGKGQGLCGQGKRTGGWRDNMDLPSINDIWVGKRGMIFGGWRMETKKKPFLAGTEHLGDVVWYMETKGETRKGLEKRVRFHDGRQRVKLVGDVELRGGKTDHDYRGPQEQGDGVGEREGKGSWDSRLRESGIWRAMRKKGQEKAPFGALGRGYQSAKL